MELGRQLGVSAIEWHEKADHKLLWNLNFAFWIMECHWRVLIKYFRWPYFYISLRQMIHWRGWDWRQKDQLGDYCGGPGERQWKPKLSVRRNEEKRMRRGNIKELTCHDSWVVRGRSQNPTFNTKSMYVKSVSPNQHYGFQTPTSPSYSSCVVQIN